ncbi:Aquaporin-3 [Hondaea fermentalgiana]|uniref:Aquaporin-3 n=1 Tax=Hondaea fermentalgiana TaxID=2315210 RepID=A0A2R5GA82_9STRA|nr:Aquaporin-3 [Hondaea fermentalgiana]|eukprot:GBG26638.1 Aquaporin-3 [Hondaea fermentalgiana]
MALESTSRDELNVLNVQDEQLRKVHVQDEEHVPQQKENSSSIDSEVNGIVSMHRKYTAWTHKARGFPTESADEMRPPTLFQQMLAEFIGTGIVCLFGLGVNCASIICGAYAGLFPVGALWGITVTLAVLTTASVSGAHLNPAVSVAFAVLRPEHFPIWKLGPFCLAQFLGAIIGSAICYGCFANMIAIKEEMEGIVRGELGSQVTSSPFNSYFPNPAFVGDTTGWTMTTVSAAGSFGIEALGTGFLMFAVLCLTDARHQLRISGGTVAIGIGLTITIVVSVFAPIDQTSINPARDFGPRLVTYALGWDTISIPGPQSGMWTYIIGPVVGTVIGGALHDLMMYGL